MIRTEKLETCEEAIAGDCSHLHISKEAVVQYFVSNLRERLKDDSRHTIIDVNISEISREHILKKLHHEIKSEYSLWEEFKGSVNPIQATSAILKQVPMVGPLGSALGAVSSDDDSEPLYKKVQQDFKELGDRKSVVIVINNRSAAILDEFAWITEIDVPSNATIVTHGYGSCRGEVEQQKQVKIGRLSEAHTEQLIKSEFDGKVNQPISAIHTVHDGNPYAITRAVTTGNPTSKIDAEEVWREVYNDKVTPEEDQVLLDSIHLVDLHPNEISKTSDNLSVMKVRKNLNSLQKKGVIVRSDSKVYSTGKYLRRYYRQRLESHEKEKRHKEALRYYIEKWSREQQSRVETESEEGFQEVGNDPEVTQYLYLALHHLHSINPNMNRGGFKKIFTSLASAESNFEDADLKRGDLFTFGLFAQRLVYDDAKEAISDLSEVIFGGSTSVEGVLAEGILSTMLEDHLSDILAELSRGWSDTEIRTGDFGVKAGFDRTEMFSRLSSYFGSDLLDELPTDVRNSALMLASLLYLDDEEGRGAYRQFGKKLEENGLEEDPFCGFMHELSDIVDMCENQTDGSDSRNILEEFEDVDENIRTRTELVEALEKKKTESQEKFDNLILNMKDRKSKVNGKLLSAGDHLENASNPVFAYSWYLIANRISEGLFDGTNRELYRLQIEHYKEREFWERENEPTVPVEELREILEEFREKKADSARPSA